jgi:hypothetical protein
VYRAPEGYDGDVSPKLDVFSLSATLFHLLTGEVPFQGDTLEEVRAAMRRGVRPDDPRWANAPGPLERVLRAGLASDPRRRPSLADFAEALRAAFHHSLTDSLALSPSGNSPAARVHLRLVLSRWVGPQRYESLATSAPASPATKRNMELIADEPERVVVRTGERVRIEVLADQPGHLVVFSVGPKGKPTRLYPRTAASGPAPLTASQPLNVGDVRMAPPAGHERLFAVWSDRPLSDEVEHLRAMSQEPEPASSGCQTSRNMEPIVASLEQAAGQWCVALLELEHQA